MTVFVVGVVVLLLLAAGWIVWQLRERARDSFELDEAYDLVRRQLLAGDIMVRIQLAKDHFVNLNRHAARRRKRWGR